MPAIPYNQPNMRKCRCAACPVHNTSACISERQAAMMAAMQPAMAGQGSSGRGAGAMAQPAARPQQAMLADPRMVEGLYCSQAVGKSKCSDLNARLACVCPTCAVWQENGLLTNYFCINGPAT